DLIGVVAGVGGEFLDAFLHAVEPLDAADLDDGDDVILLVLGMGANKTGCQKGRHGGSGDISGFQRHSFLPRVLPTEFRSCPTGMIWQCSVSSRPGSLRFDTGKLELQFVQRRGIEFAIALVEGSLVELCSHAGSRYGNAEASCEVADQARILEHVLEIEVRLEIAFEACAADAAYQAGGKIRHIEVTHQRLW